MKIIKNIAIMALFACFLGSTTQAALGSLGRAGLAAAGWIAGCAGYGAHKGFEDLAVARAGFSSVSSELTVPSKVAVEYAAQHVGAGVEPVLLAATEVATPIVEAAQEGVQTTATVAEVVEKSGIAKQVWDLMVQHPKVAACAIGVLSAASLLPWLMSNRKQQIASDTCDEWDPFGRGALTMDDAKSKAKLNFYLKVLGFDAAVGLFAGIAAYTLIPMIS